MTGRFQIYALQGQATRPLKQVYQHLLSRNPCFVQIHLPIHQAAGHQEFFNAVDAFFFYHQFAIVYRQHLDDAIIPDYEDKITTDQNIGMFLHLCLIRSVREDRTVLACNQFIKKVLGDYFT
jgi:hypothetical protein